MHKFITQPPKLQVREESFKGMRVTLKEVESDSGRWRITNFCGSKLLDLAKLIEKLLSEPEKNYYSIAVGKVKFTTGYYSEEIFRIIVESISIDELKKLIL